MNTPVHASTVVLDRADCAHCKTRVEVLPPGQYHYARVVCNSCGKQLCWQPHPRNVELRQRNAINVRKLLSSNSLNEYERGFCEGLTQNSKPSPRQQARLDRLVSKYLEKEITVNDSKNRNGALLAECAA